MNSVFSFVGLFVMLCSVRLVAIFRLYVLHRFDFACATKHTHIGELYRLSEFVIVFEQRECLNKAYAPMFNAFEFIYFFIYLFIYLLSKIEKLKIFSTFHCLLNFLNSCHEILFKSLGFPNNIIFPFLISFYVTYRIFQDTKEKV